MPTNNMNIWASCSCNRLVAERIEKRLHGQHLDALGGNVRTVTDHGCPQRYPHLRAKGKKQKLQEDRAADIQLENRILLQKMLDIDSKPSQFGPESIAKRHPPRSMHGEYHRRELDRITVDNQALLRRLQGVKTEFDNGALEELEMDRQALKLRLSQNSCAGRKSKLSMPDKRVSVSCPNLPRLPGQGPRFREDDWVQMTKNEAQLDKRLLELENSSEEIR